MGLFSGMNQHGIRGGGRVDFQPGQYLARIDEAGTETSRKGQLYLKLRFTVLKVVESMGGETLPVGAEPQVALFNWGDGNFEHNLKSVFRAALGLTKVEANQIDEAATERILEGETLLGQAVMVKVYNKTVWSKRQSKEVEVTDIQYGHVPEEVLDEHLSATERKKAGV